MYSKGSYSADVPMVSFPSLTRVYGAPEEEAPSDPAAGASEPQPVSASAPVIAIVAASAPRFFIFMGLPFPCGAIE